MSTLYGLFALIILGIAFKIYSWLELRYWSSSDCWKDVLDDEARYVGGIRHA